VSGGRCTWRKPVAALALLLLLSPAAAWADDVPLAEYRALIQDYRTAAQDRLNQYSASSLKQRFERVDAVIMPDGARVPVDNRRDIALLTEAIAKRPSQTDYETTIARARALEKALSVSPPTAERSDPKQQAAAILEAPEFKERRETIRRAEDYSWLERLIRNIARWLDRLLRRSQPNTPQVSDPLPGLVEVVRITLYVLAGAGALFAVYLLARYLAGRPELFKKTKRTGIGKDALAEDTLPDPLGASRRLAAQGDYRSALRLAYIASLRRLSAAGLLILQENKTNWEYQRQLRRRSTDAYDVLLPATRLFDEVWYGQRQATAEEYEQVAAAYDALPIARVAASPEDGAETGTTASTTRNFSQSSSISRPQKPPREGDNPW
jgi:hypothetical protein